MAENSQDLGLTRDWESQGRYITKHGKKLEEKETRSRLLETWVFFVCIEPFMYWNDQMKQNIDNLR